MSLQQTSLWRKWTLMTVTALAVTGTVGCSKNSGLAPGGGAGLVAKPTGALQIDDLARRHRGQSEFVNPYQSYFRGKGESAPASARSGLASPDAGGGAQRAIQESDVFKVGPKGAKLLYLLNNYRGLQVVSFEKGDLAPELLGRVEPTGNYPSEMYYQEEKARLVVIEQMGSNYSANASNADRNAGRLVVYDVSKAQDPRIDQVIEFVGSAADSRMVGNVLYIASGNYVYDAGANKSSGYLLSFRMDKAKIELAQTHRLSLAVSSRENMNIIEVKEASGFKYYLAAILSQSGWGWWDRMSQVEVVDMTDPNGVIKPLMTVSAKGFITERSQTSVLGNTLIVTSNYFIESQAASAPRITRVAVETFQLPSAAAETISEDEAEYRKLHIERQMGKMPVAARTDEARETLLTDKELGLKGRFVQSSTGLRKLFPDSVVTVGDTTGLSASLQDTRIDNGLLYAFWVPANMVDPLDLFDVSQPEQGAKYLGRLQFDGWISRAIPMTHQGRRFVIGLGFVNPAVNNETNRRYPQAMIFEIMNIGGKLRSVEVGQLTLKSENTWVDFNSADKMIEVRPTGDGQGEIMFQVYQWDRAGGSKQGGKIIKFDLNAITSPGAASPLNEGGLLLGDAGWLKRVFTNSEIQKINAFSDEELATFDSKGLPELSATVSAAHRLELARNIRGFEVLGTGADAVGVQIVEKGNTWSGDRQVVVNLRVVPLNNADAEVKDVSAKMQMPGSYISHLVDKNGGIFVLTQEAIIDPPNADARIWMQTSYRNRHHVGYLAPSKTLIAGSLQTTSWEDPLPPTVSRPSSGFSGLSSRFMPAYFPQAQAQLVMLEGGTVLHQAGAKIRLLQAAVGTLTAQEVSLMSCQVENRIDLKLQVVGGSLYLSSKQMIPDEARENVSFAKNFISKVSLAGGDAACSDEMNIPGELVGVTADHFLVSDTSLKDIVKVEYEVNRYIPVPMQGQPAVPADEPRTEKRIRYDMTLQKSLISLKRDLGKAVLVDERTLTDSEAIHSLGGALVLMMKNPASVQYGRFGYQQTEDDGLSNNLYRTADTRPEFKFFEVGTDGFITEDSRISDVDLKTASIVKLIPQGNERIAVLSSGSAVQVVNFDLTARTPRLMTLQKVQSLKSGATEPQLSQPTRVVKAAGLWALSSGNTISWNAEKSTLALSLGLTGIIEVKAVK